MVYGMVYADQEAKKCRLPITVLDSSWLYHTHNVWQSEVARGGQRREVGAWEGRVREEVRESMKVGESRGKAQARRQFPSPSEERRSALFASRFSSIQKLHAFAGEDCKPFHRLKLQPNLTHTQSAGAFQSRGAMKVKARKRGGWVLNFRLGVVPYFKSAANPPVFCLQMD
jgi:hypothetical protein